MRPAFWSVDCAAWTSDLGTWRLACCYRHDYLVMDRRSTVTLICDGAARSCFRTQASLSRSVIGSAGPQAAGPSRSPNIRASARRVSVSAPSADQPVQGGLSRSGNREALPPPYGRLGQSQAADGDI